MGQGGMILIRDVGVGTLALVGVGIDATGQIHGLGWVYLEVLVLAIVALNFILITSSMILISTFISILLSRPAPFRSTGIVVVPVDLPLGMFF